MTLLPCTAGEGGRGNRGGGARSEAEGKMLHLAPRPSTMLRMVVLPIFDGEEPR